MVSQRCWRGLPRQLSAFVAALVAACALRAAGCGDDSCPPSDVAESRFAAYVSIDDSGQGDPSLIQGGDAETLHLAQLRGLKTSRSAAPPESGWGIPHSVDGVPVVPKSTADRLFHGKVAFFPPIERQVLFEDRVVTGYTLEIRSPADIFIFQCVAERGGLVTALKLNGDNFLVDQPVGPSGVQGGTVWTSPQSSWGWPPPAAFDTATYDVEVDTEGMSITLSGPIDELTGLRLIKRFYVVLDELMIRTEITIRNERSEQARQVAPWIILRVWPRGLSFYRSGTNGTHRGELAGVMTETRERSIFDGGRLQIQWFQHSMVALDQAMGGKLFADPAQGWLAHTDGKNLMLLTFPPHRTLAPNESLVEMYALPGYEELEYQGRYETLALGQSLTWNTGWVFRRLPPGVSAVVGNDTLVEFTENVQLQVERYNGRMAVNAQSAV